MNYELKIISYLCGNNSSQGDIAQLARALAWHARGHGFDSHYLHPIKS